MKIAYVITRSDEVGGAHIHVRDMAQWMSDLGHQVKVFVGGAGIFTEKLVEVDLPVYELRYMQRQISPLNDIRAVKELRTALQEFAPDLVSAHSAKAGMIARIACWGLGVPCVFTAHGWSFARGTTRPKRDIFLLIEKVLAPLSANIITVCEQDKSFALTHSLCSKEKIRVIHNAMPEISENLRAKPNNECARLIMVARFEYPKDHKMLIDALANLKDLNWSLDLVGDGPLMEDVREQARVLNIINRIKFLGRRWDVAELMSSADVFILTSFWEGFPRSIIEAMRAGLPVVASDVAGVSEAVIDDLTGYLIKDRNRNELENKLSVLIANPDQRMRLGEAGRKRYEELFTFEQMANKTLNLYNQTLKIKN